MPLCDKYRDDANTFGFCVARFANSLPSIADMEQACSQAGEWEEQCRHGWVAGRQQHGSGFTTEELLAACGETPDCTFELIDFRPDPDPIVQITRCAKYTGPYGRDCAGHAMQRFWLTDPTPERWAEVAVARVPFQDRVGYWLGVEVACFQKGECVGDGPVRHNCQQTVSDFQRNPARCPNRQKMQMPKPEIHNNAPQPGAQPGTQPGQPGQPGQRPPGRPPGTPPPGQGG